MSFLIIKLTFYKVLLFCIYYFILAVHYKAANFVQTDAPSLYSSSISWIIFILSLPFGVKLYKKDDLSGNIFFALYLVYFIPSLCFWEFNHLPWQYIASQLLYFVLFALAILTIPEFKHIHRYSSNYTTYYYSVLFIVSTIIYVCFIATDSSLILSFKDVYTIRFLWRMDTMPITIRYLFGNCRCLLSLLFGIAVYRKSVVESLFILLLVLISFSVDGLKSVVFITLLSGCGIFINYKNKHILNGILMVSSGGYLEYFAAGSINIADYTRRVLAVPAQLNYFSFQKNAIRMISSDKGY